MNQDDPIVSITDDIDGETSLAPLEHSFPVSPRKVESTPIRPGSGTIEISSPFLEKPLNTAFEAPVNQEVLTSPEVVPGPPDAEEDLPSEESVTDIASQSTVLEEVVVDLTTEDVKVSPVSDAATPLTKFADREEEEFITKILEEKSPNGSK